MFFPVPARQQVRGKLLIIKFVGKYRMIYDNPFKITSGTWQ
jgi:hypothetical protein